MNFLFLLASLVTSLNCAAAIDIYKSTDNTGINKLERIEVIEKYLINLSSTLKSMEAKLDSQTLKLNSLEQDLKTIREKDIKALEQQIAEKKVGTEKSVDTEEFQKLKEDILSIKNDDIERIRRDIQLLKLK